MQKKMLIVLHTRENTFSFCGGVGGGVDRKVSIFYEAVYFPQCVFFYFANCETGYHVIFAY